MKTIEIEGDYLTDAREKIKANVPKGFKVILEETLEIGEEEKTVEGIAETIEDAFAKAESSIPPSATVISKKEIAIPEQRFITVEAFNEKRAIELATKRASTEIGHTAIVRNVKLDVSGSKGFLGIGGKPNQYIAEIFVQAAVAITIKPKSKIRITITEGDDTKASKKIVNKELKSDTEIRPKINERGYLNTANSFFSQGEKIMSVNKYNSAEKREAMNHFREAIKHYDQVIKANPRNTEAHYQRAQALLRLTEDNKYDVATIRKAFEAWKEFFKVADLKNNYLDPKAALARWAIQHLETVLKVALQEQSKSPQHIPDQQAPEDPKELIKLLSHKDIIIQLKAAHALERMSSEEARLPLSRFYDTVTTNVDVAVRTLVIAYDQSPTGGFHWDSPGEKAVRGIGEKLNEKGGLDLMLKVHAAFAQKRPQPGTARNLEITWGGVGGWQG